MFQLAHIQGYARSASTKVATKKNGHPVKKSPARSVAEILAEVLRDLGACYHVDGPQPPIFHHGSEEEVRAIPARIDANIAHWQAMGNKTVRKDAQVLYTQICSFERGQPGYEQWLARNVEMLKAKYGDRLVSIIEHQDEAHPHLHVYCLPLPGESPDIKVSMHVGHIAGAPFAKDPKAQSLAYKKAMQGFQDEYFEQVGMFCGMTRIGPGRRRLDRGAYMAEKANAKTIANALAIVGREQKALDARRADLEAQQAALKADTAALAVRGGAIDAEVAGKVGVKATQLAAALHDAHAKRVAELDAEVQAKVVVAKRADAVVLMKKATPAMPTMPKPWEFWKVGEFVDRMKRVASMQAAKLVHLPLLREKIDLMQAEGARVIAEKNDLVEQVKTLSMHAQAWALVQQIAPDVARRVVEQMNRKAELVPVVQGRGAETTVAISPAQQLPSM